MTKKTTEKVDWEKLREPVARKIALSEMRNIADADVDDWLNRVWGQKLPAAEAAIAVIKEALCQKS